MDIYRRLMVLFRYSVSGAGTCQQRTQHLVAQDKKGNQSSQTISGGFIAAGMLSEMNQVFAAKLFQIIGCMTGSIRGVVFAEDFHDLFPKLRCAKPMRFYRKRYNSFNDSPHPGTIYIYTCHPSGTYTGWRWPVFKSPCINKGNVNTVQNQEKSLHNTSERLDNIGALPQCRSMVLWATASTRSTRSPLL